jgi:hypothetical protein
MTKRSVQALSGPTLGEPTFGPAIPIRRTRRTGLVAASLASYGPCYAALLRDLCRARSIAANRGDWLQFRVLGDEVAMVGAVIAHQARLREAAAA